MNINQETGVEQCLGPRHWYFTSGHDSLLKYFARQMAKCCKYSTGLAFGQIFIFGLAVAVPVPVAIYQGSSSILVCSGCSSGPIDIIIGAIRY